MSDKSPDPMHGVTLEMMIERLQEQFGWDGLAQRVPIRCFSHDPSVKSSLKFLRRTPWARAKVEALYLQTVQGKKVNPLNGRGKTEAKTVGKTNSPWKILPGMK
ncbi:MAG: DUF2132 domain-containing protein [Pseudomonadales bacterium]|nr:DUF2132 domain-containing protein [Pseudomonadales bacterium]